MANIWATEAWAIVIAACSLILLGELGGNWFFAALITLGSYISWLYYRLLKLETWIRNGTKLSQVYEDRGFVGIIIRQLQEQKKIHNQRKRKTKRVLRRLNRNISALPDATVLLDNEFRIEWCNEPARYLLNLRSPQDLGYKISNLIRDPEFLAYLNNPESRDFTEIESQIDENITIQVKLVVFGGNQLLLIARNVSDQKQLQQGLKNFVANASHELRSPLTLIAGHLEMLEAETNLSDAGQRSLQTAQRQAERMKNLIEELLLLSQVESSSLEPGEGEKISLSELMDNVIAALEKYAGWDRVDLEYPEDLSLLGIRIEIESICINLIENAIKYSTPETPIRASWIVNDRGEFRFSVEDQGPGIDPDEIPRITERYFRGARSRAETAGSGLGLAIVKHAAKKHGGRFSIDSKPGQGSRFSVIFPSYRCTRAATPADEAVNVADR